MQLPVGCCSTHKQKQTCSIPVDSDGGLNQSNQKIQMYRIGSRWDNNIVACLRCCICCLTQFLTETALSLFLKFLHAQLPLGSFWEPYFEKCCKKWRMAIAHRLESPSRLLAVPASSLGQHVEVGQVYPDSSSAEFSTPAINISVVTLVVTLSTVKLLSP